MDDGADLVETAFLLQGLLAARQYLDRPGDAALRARIDRLADFLCADKITSAKWRRRLSQRNRRRRL